MFKIFRRPQLNSLIAVLLPIWLAKGLTLGPEFTFIILYWIISLVITTVSTTLIVYRIFNMTRRSNKTASYYPTVEILVESGAMYTITIILCCALWGSTVASSKTETPPSAKFTRLNKVGSAIYSLLIPVTVSRTTPVIFQYEFNTLFSGFITGDCTNTDNTASWRWSFQGGCGMVAAYNLYCLWVKEDPRRRRIEG